MKQLSQQVFLSRFGAVQTNAQWAWSAVNHEERTCYFRAWIDLRRTDENGDKYYMIQELGWGRGDSNNALGFDDQNMKFDLALNLDYSVRIYFVEAEDIKADPRTIKSTKTSFVFDAVLVKTDSEIRAYPHPHGITETPYRDLGECIERN